VNRRSVWRMVAVLLALLTAGVACSSGGSGSKESQKGSQAPEEHRASAADVTAGLTKIAGIVAPVSLAAGTDARAAKDLNKGIEPAWQQVEGTVRANDKDLYIRFEDDFAALTKAADAGDGAKAQQTAVDVADAIKTYLAKFPG
jgi:hypothetical protein